MVKKKAPMRKKILDQKGEETKKKKTWWSGKNSNKAGPEPNILEWYRHQWGKEKKMGKGETKPLGVDRGCAC